MGSSVAYTNGWRRFVDEVVREVDAAWDRGVPPNAWRKTDGSQVTPLDLQLDMSVRACLSRHFPHASVLSEETGHFFPKDHDRMVAIVDPIDGTESLLAGRDSWWMSVGLGPNELITEGLIYQPSTRRVHDSSRPQSSHLRKLVVGVSPDILVANESQSFRARMDNAGAKLVATPHAVEKVAAVLEGRTSASVYLPSKKSPRWHSWDLAAAIAIARANGLILRIFNGDELQIDPARVERTEGWICANSEAIWKVVRSSTG